MNLDFCPSCFQSTHESTCPYCGYNIGELGFMGAELKPGTIIGGHYKIGAILGVGGFGITYIGYDLNTNIRYAIKEFVPRDISVRKGNRIEPSSADNIEIYNDGLDKFLYETNLLVTLSGNRSIVEAHDFIAENNTAYLIMEYLDGVSVKNYMKSRGVIDCSFAIQIMQEVSNALYAVHAKGLLHRDISPDNIMLLADGRIKLIDFGAARFFVGERSRSLSLVLKHGFAPPEQYSSNSNQGPWTDIYALAASFYKMVTGETLPDALSRASQDTVERLDKINPGVPAHVGKAVQKALSVNYRDRYQTVDQFMHALKWMPPVNNINNEVSVMATADVAPKKKGFWASLFGGGDEIPQQQWTPPPPPPPDPTPQVSQYAPPQPPSSQEKQAFIRIIQGAQSVGRWQIWPDTPVYIGRDSSMCSIVVYASSISRKHCVIQYDGQRNVFYITDVSSNGTFFGNGAKLERDATYELNSGDVVMLSSEENIMEVELV